MFLFKTIFFYSFFYRSREVFCITDLFHCEDAYTLTPPPPQKKKKKKLYLGLLNFCRLLIRKFGAFWWMHPRKDIRGCLHEKTRTGASFMRGWLFFVVMTRSFHISLFEGTLHVDKNTSVIQNCKHCACASCSSLPADFTPKRVVVSRLHDTAAGDFVPE